MFSLNGTMRYYVYPRMADMRKGMHTLCGLVHGDTGREILQGDVYVFVGGGGRTMKIIHADDGGLVMYVKRLEAGRFRMPDTGDEAGWHEMEWRDLVLMVEGITEDPARRLRRLRAERKTYTI